MDTQIKMEQIYKKYVKDALEIEVLKNINMNINKGEFVSVMGASGSGKSTLLYLIGGLDKPTSGNVKINGKDINTMNDIRKSEMRRKNIGFVFQFYNLVPNLTVEDNILLPILLDGRKRKDYNRKLDEIIADINLQHRRHHMPNELSGGEQQRVAIARALINNPDIILADEATGNLDSKAGREIMSILKKINKSSGKTIVQVTHSHEIAEYSDRIINIKDGEVCG